MLKIPVDSIIHSASELVTVRKKCDGPKRRGGMDWLDIIEDGALAIKDGHVAAVGQTSHILEYYECPSDEMISAAEKTVLPGLVDPHTHLVFAGSRHDEYVQKIKGKTYAEIHKMNIGAGINHTVEMTRKASASQLAEKALNDLDIMMTHGTTTIEAKSGYGLDCENEIKILEVIRWLSQSHLMTIVPTFLGAHTIPIEYQDNRKKYVNSVVSMLAGIKTRGLAEFCDVFCDPLGFSLAETYVVLAEAKKLGFGIKLHAEQTKPFGGSAIAAAFRAISADHLDFADPCQIMEMTDAGVIGVLLPGATYHLMETNKVDFPDLVHRMIETGLPIALGTDYNPGSSPTKSMQTVMELAARLYRMTPAQIISAATINAAYAIGRGKEIGSLEPGKWADVAIFDCPKHEMIVNDFGTNKVSAVIKKGIKIH